MSLALIAKSSLIWSSLLWQNRMLSKSRPVAYCHRPVTLGPACVVIHSSLYSLYYIRCLSHPLGCILSNAPDTVHRFEYHSSTAIVLCSVWATHLKKSNWRRRGIFSRDSCVVRTDTHQLVVTFVFSLCCIVKYIKVTQLCIISCNTLSCNTTT